MVTRIQRIILDDLDQSSTGDISTYRFALEGTEYEIDLSAPNIDQLRTALRPYIAAGRRLPKNRTDRRSGGRGKNAAVVRQWWHDHQHEGDLPPFNPRGAIPQRVIAAMHAAGQP